MKGESKQETAFRWSLHILSVYGLFPCYFLTQLHQVPWELVYMISWFFLKKSSAVRPAFHLWLPPPQVRSGEDQPQPRAPQWDAALSADWEDSSGRLLPCLEERWADNFGSKPTFCLSVSLASLRSGRSVWAGVRDDVQPHPVHLWRHGDPSHRDSLGLHGQEGQLLHQLTPQSEAYQ